MANFFVDQKQWARQIVENHADAFGVGVIVSDIDDTILDSEGKWYQYYGELAREQGLLPTSITPRVAFRPRHDIGPLVPDYNQLKDELMHDAAFHTDMSVLLQSANLAKAGKARGLPHGYLSTRPGALGEVTHENLHAYDFAPTPMLLRDEGILYSDTVAYKIGALTTLRAMLDDNGHKNSPLYYVDDYDHLIDEINARCPNIVGVHFHQNMDWRVVTQAAGVTLQV